MWKMVVWYLGLNRPVPIVPKVLFRRLNLSKFTFGTFSRRYSGAGLILTVSSHHILEIGETMMKIKSASGITYYVKDLKKTVSFYETLGFETKKQDANHATLYSNWFWIDFLSIAKNERAEFTKDTDLNNKGAGVYLYLSVDDVDAFHKFLLSKKLKPSSKPQDQPWGNREFILRDPDGYKLVIFKRK